MTPLQADCLAYIQFLLAGDLKALAALYQPSGVMAHIQIESSWEPEVGDHVDSFGSAGLMQVLPSTAVQMGVTGSMLNPQNSIRAGMLYLDNCRTILAHYRAKTGGALTIQDVVAAYNEGPGNVMRGRADPHYVDEWEAAQKQWAYVDALPVDPKAVEALFHWGQSNTPPAEIHQDETDLEPAPQAPQATTGAPAKSPSEVEPEPAPKEPAEADAALDSQGPGSADQQEQGDEADLLNEEEAAQLHVPPAEPAVEVAENQGATDPSAGNASLDGA